MIFEIAAAWMYQMAAPKVTLRTKTLLRIAEHGDKLIRLSQLVSEMDSPFLLAATSYLDEESTSVDIIDAFEKDLSATAVMLKKVALIVEDVNSEHISPELLTKFSPEQSNLKMLFPEHYHAEDQTLQLFGVKMKARGSLSKTDTSDVKKVIYDQMVGDLRSQFPYDEYKKHLSVMRKLQSSEKPSVDDSDYDIYSYAGLLVKAESWTLFCQHVLTAVHKEAAFRAGLSFDDRRLVDERIVGGRAMIDGVIKSSTYISKDEVIQTAAAHKKDPLLPAVIRLAQTYDNLTGLELDSSASLEKTHVMLQKMEAMGLRLPDAFELKIRLLGNYGASGLHISGAGEVQTLAGYASASLRIVAIDPKSPTSLAHELAHFCDHYSDANERDARNALVRSFSEKMLSSSFHEKNPLPANYVQYLLRDREIFARLGEIGFTLLELNYQDGETFEQLRERANLKAESNAGSDVALDVAISKDLHEYAGNNPAQAWMYFDLATWTPRELGLIKTLAVSLYQDHSPEIKAQLRTKIEENRVASTTAELVKRKTQQSPRVRVKTESEKIFELLKNINGHELAGLVSVVLREGLAQEGDVTRMFARYGKGVGAGIKTTSVKSLYEQVGAMASVVPVLMNHGYTIDAHMMYEIALRFAVRTTLFSATRPADDGVSPMLAADLSRIYAASSLIGTQGQITNDVSGVKQTLVSPIEMPFSHRWQIKRVLKAEDAAVEREPIMPNLMEARSLLLADSGAPGVVSAAALENHSGQLNDLARNRLIANSFYHQMMPQASLPEDVFDWWHDAQRTASARHVFGASDETLMRTLLATGNEVTRLFDVAAVEWKLNEFLDAAAFHFLETHESSFSALSKDNVVEWIKACELQNQADRKRVLKELVSDDPVVYAMPVKDSAWEHIQHYLAHINEKNMTRESVRAKPETVIHAAFSRYDGVDVRQTAARTLSKLVTQLRPELKDAWVSMLNRDPEIQKTLEKDVGSRMPAGWSRGDVLFQPNLGSGGTYLEKNDSVEAGKVERENFAWTHPVNSLFRSMLLEDNKVSDFLLSAVNVALVRRVVLEAGSVIDVNTNGQRGLLAAHESADGVRIAGLLDAVKFAKHAFESLQMPVEQPSFPEQHLQTLSEMRARLDRWAVRANELSPEVTRMVLESSVFAPRSYGATLEMKMPSRPLYKAWMDLGRAQQAAALPLLQDNLLLQPASVYIEHATARVNGGEVMALNATPKIRDEDLPFLPNIAQTGSGEVAPFDDAPLLPMDDVAMSVLSPEAQEQIAYFMAINAEVPSAGMGPLMPKKHQMRLF